MEESIGFRSSRCWKCLVLSVLFIALAQIQECLSLPVPKYTRAISHHYNTNNNNKLFSKVKSYPDIIFDTEPLKRAYGDSLTLRDEAPLIDIYNDRIYFREPTPSRNNIFDYIRSFPTTTEHPVTANFRRFVSLPPAAETPSSTTTTEAPARTETKERRRSSESDDVLNIGSTEGNGSGQVPLAWLQDWVKRNNYTTMTDGQGQGQSEGQGQDTMEKESEELKIAFQSLFQVPTANERRPPCPPHQRRSHHGNCVRSIRIRYRVIEEDVN